MNKILRLTLMTLLAMVGIVGYADTTVTFTAGTDQEGAQYTGSGSPSSGEETVTKDGISIATSNGAFKANQYRVYKSATFTVTSTVGNITKVVVTCTANGTQKQGPGNFTKATAGEYTYETSGKTGTWTGNAATFTMTASSNQVRMTTVEVTYTSGGTTTTVTAPEISGTTPFTDKTTVTITVPTGTTVYYTTDGSTPSDQGDEYDSPFEISATTTVKAVAYDNAGNHSSVVSKEFVKKANVTTTGQGTLASPYTVADANAILAAKAETTDTVFVSGTISQISEISTEYGNGTYYISDDGTTTNQLEVFRSYYLGNVKYTSEDQVKVGDKVVVKSVLVNYTNKDNTVTPELSKGYLYSLNGKTTADTPVIPTETAANIAAFNAISNNTPVVLTLTNAVVLYSWTSTNKNTSTYIRDASGAMLLYNSGIELKEGDVLNGTINVTRSAYNNNIQAAKNDNTNADNLTITSGSAPEPKTIASSEASKYANDLVLIKNVDILAVGTRFYIVSDVSGDSLQVYNGFHLDGYTVAAASNVTIKGIVVDSKYGYEIQPTEDPATTTTGITGIKGDETSVNAPAYNLAGQRVGRDYKGVVIQNGKKRIRK